VTEKPGLVYKESDCFSVRSRGGPVTEKLGLVYKESDCFSVRSGASLVTRVWYPIEIHAQTLRNSAPVKSRDSPPPSSRENVTHVQHTTLYEKRR
jgi:hypothetical protein